MDNEKIVEKLELLITHHQAQINILNDLKMEFSKGIVQREEVEISHKNDSKIDEEIKKETEKLEQRELEDSDEEEDYDSQEEDVEDPEDNTESEKEDGSEEEYEVDEDPVGDDEADLEQQTIDMFEDKEEVIRNLESEGVPNADAVHSIFEDLSSNIIKKKKTQNKGEN